MNRNTISPCQTKVNVTELDFFKGIPKDDTDIRETDIIVVGDVIYDQVGDGYALTETKKMEDCNFFLDKFS